MKRALVVCALVLIAGLWASGEALACGRRCVNVAPSGSLPCLRCVEDSASPADCRNDPGTACGCYFVACFGRSQVEKGADVALAGIFSDDTKPVACSALPAEISE